MEEVRDEVERVQWEPGCSKRTRASFGLCTTRLGVFERSRCGVCVLGGVALGNAKEGGFGCVVGT